MVNIRATLDAAMAEGILDPWLGCPPLRDREGAVLQTAELAGDPTRLADRRLLFAGFTKWLPGGQVNQKRWDALEMIAAIRAHLAARLTRFSVSSRFHDTGYHKATTRRLTERGGR